MGGLYIQYSTILVLYKENYMIIPKLSVCAQVSVSRIGDVPLKHNTARYPELARDLPD